MRIVTASPQSTPRALPAMLGPWRHKVFFSIWLAMLASNFGSLIQMVGASWLMTSLTTSADMVALVQTSTSLPILLFALLAGALADIHDRRIVMLAAQWLLFAVSVLLALLTLLDLLTPWTLLSLTFLIGMGAALHGPSWQASVGEQVPREDIPAAVALNSLGFNLARAVGPAIGGVIVATSGATTAFVINACTYVGIIVVLLRWKRERPVSPLPPERIVPAIQAGLRYVRLSPSIRSVLFRALGFGFTGSAIWALNPLVARYTLHGDAGTYGMLLGGLGVGAVGGALVSGHIRARLRNEITIRLFTAAFGLGSVVVASSPWTALSFAALVICGVCWVISISTFNITVQLASPRWVVGRAMSLMQMSLFGGMAVGSWMWGHLAEWLGLQQALTSAGLLMTASVLLGLHFRLAETEKADLAPVRAGQKLDVEAPVGMEAAAVVVAVEYNVAPEDWTAFVDAMREKSRIRRRDGARRWVLMQDLSHPEIWIERFENPSWTDYLRQRHRATVADSEIEQRVRNFHRGDEPPHVRRMIEHRTDSVHLDDHHHYPVMRQGPLH